MRRSFLLILLALFVIRPEWASGQTGSFEPGVDRPGLDLRNLTLQEPNPVACQASCAATSGCVAWTYVKPGVQGPAARCWLKHSVPNAVQRDCCVSGVLEVTATARQAFEQHGLIGTFAPDCSAPVSATNNYVVYRAVDDRHVQRDTMASQTARLNVSIAASATAVPPNQISVTATGDGKPIRYTLQIDGLRHRLMQWMQSGVQTIANGGLQNNTPTPWLNKCN